jgi:hypothetical protein
MLAADSDPQTSDTARFVPSEAHNNAFLLREYLINVLGAGVVGFACLTRQYRHLNI